MTSPSATSNMTYIVKHFQDIGENNLRDLPIYHPQLFVEAVDFQTFETDWLGVLITPWFMSLMLFPQTWQPWNSHQDGHKIARELPAKTYWFIQSGDEKLGTYYSHSLYSPMHFFPDQKAARQAAQFALQQALTPPSPTKSPTKLDRRAMLRGEFFKS